MSKIRKSAKGQDCLIRLPRHCNFNSETTVLCHAGGGGMGRKSHDIHAAYGCSSCHAVIDGHVSSTIRKDDLKLYMLEAVLRTQLVLLDKGLIKI